MMTNQESCVKFDLEIRRMEPKEILIYVDTKSPETPWIVRYRDDGSITGWNEIKTARISSRKPFVTSLVNEHSVKLGRYAIRSMGAILEGIDHEGFKHVLID